MLPNVGGVRIPSTERLAEQQMDPPKTSETHISGLRPEVATFIPTGDKIIQPDNSVGVCVKTDDMEGSLHDEDQSEKSPGLQLDKCGSVEFPETQHIDT